LRSELLSAYKRRLSKPQVDQILDRTGLEPTVRAEQLDCDTMLSLAQVVRAEVGDS
jgi:16S rRNA A1518/A1519 N6-dimethyltransferase RsmA/KsgA/DIM1 with predicted DNA glycosylase/AP lyase activity